VDCKLNSFAGDYHGDTPWLQHPIPSHLWESRDVRRQYIDWLVSKVGLESRNDLRVSHFYKNSGASLLNRYGSSPLKVVNSLVSDESSEAKLDSLHIKPQKYWVFFVFIHPLLFFFCFSKRFLYRIRLKTSEFSSMKWGKRLGWLEAISRPGIPLILKSSVISVFEAFWRDIPNQSSICSELFTRITIGNRGASKYRSADIFFRQTN
jgi:hypothetical protein